MTRGPGNGFSGLAGSGEGVDAVAGGVSWFVKTCLEQELRQLVASELLRAVAHVHHEVEDDGFEGGGFRFVEERFEDEDVAVGTQGVAGGLEELAADVDGPVVEDVAEEERV